MTIKKEKLMLGWREWLALPGLGISRIKAKVDTGAKTSCLHAFFIEPYKHDGVDYVRFGVHPFQKNTEEEIVCEARVHDQREVTDSGGHCEMRYVIVATITIGNNQHDIELTLTNRDSMKFRMLLGRAVLMDNYIVDPSLSYNLTHQGEKE